MTSLSFPILLLVTIVLGPRLESHQRDFDILGDVFVAIQVRDDSATGAWYSRIFDLEEVNHLAADDGRYSIRILTGEGMTVELINERQAQEPPARSFGRFKVGLFVDDVESAHDWLRQSGVDVDDQIVTDEALGVQTFVFRDLEGNRIQLFEELE